MKVYSSASNNPMINTHIKLIHTDERILFTGASRSAKITKPDCEPEMIIVVDN